MFNLLISAHKVGSLEYRVFQVATGGAVLITILRSSLQPRSECARDGAAR